MTPQIKANFAQLRISFGLRTLMAAGLLCAIAIPTRADIITVTNTNDSGSGSLRQALADANDGDTINFDPSIYGQTITLTSAELVIDRSVTISGPGAGSLAVDASAMQFDRVFHVMAGLAVSIEGLTITGGRAFDGGGIYNYQSTLTVSNCIVHDNHGASGAGIYNDARQGSATLTVLNSIITDNCACRDSYSVAGGGMAGGGELTIVNTTVSNNIAVSFPDLVGVGGGISTSGILTITDSTISGNAAAYSGGGDH